MCIFRKIAFFLLDIGCNRRVTTTLPRCEACGKAVYLTEKLSAEDGNTFHKVLTLYAVLSPKEKQSLNNNCLTIVFSVCAWRHASAAPRAREFLRWATTLPLKANTIGWFHRFFLSFFFCSSLGQQLLNSDLNLNDDRIIQQATL